MALSSVLVDRGRAIVRKQKMQRNADGSLVPVKVEGEVQFAWVYGPYFDCRVDSPAAPKRPDAAGGRDRAALSPVLVFDAYDENDDPVELTADDRVSVESDQFGTFVYELTGEPEMFRKKVDVLAGQVTVVRIMDFGVKVGDVTQFADGATAAIAISPSGS